MSHMRTACLLRSGRWADQKYRETDLNGSAIGSAGTIGPALFGRMSRRLQAAMRASFCWMGALELTGSHRFVKRRGGAIWRDESIDTWASLHSVAFHKGSFVIVGSGGIILGSTVEDPKLIGLRIIGDSAVGSGSVIGFQCLAEFSTGELVDVSSAATWSIGSSSPPGTYLRGERLVAGSTLNDFSVQIVARYSDGVVTAKSMPFNVTIKAGLRAWISRSIRLDQTDAAGKVSLSAESSGTTGPVSYRWNLTGSASHGSLTSRETEA